MEPIRFRSQIRYWNPDKSSGLAVVDIPGHLIPAFRGLKQQRVRGSIGAVEFPSNVMPAGSGRLALSVSKAMMSVAGAGIGDEVEIVITGVGVAIWAATEQSPSRPGPITQGDSHNPRAMVEDPCPRRPPMPRGANARRAAPTHAARAPAPAPHASSAHAPQTT